MSKYWLDLKCVDYVPEAYRKSSSEIMAYTGANTGNLVFRHALTKMIANCDEYRVVDWGMMRDIISQGQPIEQVIVSCANWLGLGEQDEKSNKVRADIINSIDAPVISFGLGAQAKSGSDVAEFGPNTQELAWALSRKCEQLSVRDEFTRRSLDAIGIQNAVVTGCPSNFINHDSLLGEKVASKALRLAEENVSLLSLRSSITEFSGGNKHSGPLLESTLKVLRDSPSFYVLQSPQLYPFLLRESDELHGAYTANSGGQKKVELTNLMKSKAVGFSSVDSWLEFSSTCDFSFGMRIHGNMVPIQAEVPAFLIAHDSRTSGLSECMGVPNVTPDEFMDNYLASPDTLYKRVANVMAEYDAKRTTLYRVWLSYFSDNSVDASPSFLSMV